ncbi:MAG: DUF3108 domain-containing protein [Acidobacteria bacterium]|nr:DUF3108 domain-containing protein [Acidobacteriota bacterium]
MTGSYRLAVSGIGVLLSAALWILFSAAAGTDALQAGETGSSVAGPGYPVPVGERLAYAIEWDPPWWFLLLPTMHAADAELEITQEGEFRGRRTYKIVLKAQSRGILASLSGMTIDDEFVFLSEPDTLCTFSASKKIREGKRKRQIDVEYFRDTGQLHIRELDESVTPPEIRKDALKDNIPACVQDPLSALYFLRRIPLEKDSVHTSVIGHDDVVKEVKSRVLKLETLQTTGGELPAWKIDTVALLGGLFKEGGQFKIWLSADERQIPLQFEVKVKIGRVTGKLKKTDEEPQTGPSPE